MSSELTVLALSGLLLLVHVFAAIHVKTRAYGVEWNMGARDEDKPAPNALAGRLDRARGNFLETLPLALIGLFGIELADKANAVTAIAAWVWLIARVIYLPLYAAGVPRVRTYVWAGALLALLAILGVLLLG